MGYTGGNDDATDPSYREVCSGATGHAEAVQIEYDPSKLKYEDLVGELVSCNQKCKESQSVLQNTFTVHMILRP